MRTICDGSETYPYLQTLPEISSSISTKRPESDENAQSRHATFPARSLTFKIYSFLNNWQKKRKNKIYSQVTGYFGHVLSIFNNYISLFFGTFVALNPDKKKKRKKKESPAVN